MAEGIDVSLFKEDEFTAEYLEELMKDQGVSLTARVKLKKQFRDLKAGKQLTTAQAKFEDFFARVGGAVQSRHDARPAQKLCGGPLQRREGVPS